METSSDVRLGPAGRGGPVILGRMSQLGQFRPIPLAPIMSALPPTPTIDDVGEVQSRLSCAKAGIRQ